MKFFEKIGKFIFANFPENLGENLAARRPGEKYEIKKGDNLWKISGDFLENLAADEKSAIEKIAAEKKNFGAKIGGGRNCEI